MSPQLHTWIYGFFPHSFVQQIRQEGFRAVVFLGHGLLVSMFLTIILGVACTLKKQKINTPFIHINFIIIYLLVVLILSKSSGPLVLGIVLILGILFIPLKLEKYLLTVLTFIVIFYPLLSIFHLFPHDQLVNMSSFFSPERADSLEFRFFHEQRLLQHAEDEFLFGWGGWGRNRLFDSVTDGYWIITFGVSGFIGFISIFGLPFLSIKNAIKIVNDRMSKLSLEKKYLLDYSLMIVVILIDQIPNASMNVFFWFLIGMLYGSTKYILKSES